MLTDTVGLASILLEVLLAMVHPKGDNRIATMPIQAVFVLHFPVVNLLGFGPIAQFPLDDAALLRDG
jgi:hypothetical protein